ncbi:NEQ042 [Nanoarchaeum equitans Kin4-M]|uniref:Metal-dependent carboxypeptidase n=1 Tax=Nanoarchaeum equitans (strain Kin4-M) TaxID=228908 RepID=Q74N50_NANEQ|nr:NEQ042 [Nanoarchaeum equitans Kin4-M]
MDLVKKILDHYEKIWVLAKANAVLEWDSETYMPKGETKERGFITSKIESMIQDLMTDKEFIKWVEQLEEKAENDFEKGIARVLKRSIYYYTKIPKKELEEYNKLIVEAVRVWEDAKKKSDFNRFAPYLEKIVEFKRKFAEYLGYKYSPYDALLDRYEEGYTVKDIDPLFNRLKRDLKKEYERIKEIWHDYHWLENEPYNRERMELLNKTVLSMIGFDFNHMRLDVSAHPFTIELGLYDIRITTWYHKKDFRRSLLAVIHEFGHALYERQIDEKLWKTPLQGGVSLGIHESQSRFWEIVVAKTKEFTQFLEPLVKNILKIDADSEDLFKYFTIVRPIPIRVESDDVTYNFHIILRYEIERDLIEGKIDVRDIPEIWNEKMEQYLGIKPKNDSEGALQDIHWSLGAIGYFPTYTLGNLIAAQIKYNFPDLETHIENKNFATIREYLREKIHKYGSMYEPKVLLEKSFGEPVNEKYFIKLLRERYR